MNKITTYCDCCGRPTIENILKYRVPTWDEQSNEDKMDLCDDCSSQFAELFRKIRSQSNFKHNLNT